MKKVFETHDYRDIYRSNFVYMCEVCNVCFRFGSANNLRDACHKTPRIIKTFSWAKIQFGFAPPNCLFSLFLYYFFFFYIHPLTNINIIIIFFVLHFSTLSPFIFLKTLSNFFFFSFLSSKVVPVFVFLFLLFFFMILFAFYLAV